jgi:hypothetical protein
MAALRTELRGLTAQAGVRRPDFGQMRRDHGTLALGDGLEQIVGVIGVQP